MKLLLIIATLALLAASATLMLARPTPEPVPPAPMPLIAAPLARATDAKAPGVVPMQLRPVFAAVARRYGLDPVLLAAVAMQESRFQSDARSAAGAEGLMQFMPETAKHFGVDVNSDASSIDGAARYLCHLLKLFDGNQGLALAAYNWGEGNVRRWRRKGSKVSRMPKETRAYVFAITGRSVAVWAGQAKTVGELLAGLGESDHQSTLAGEF